MAEQGWEQGWEQGCRNGESARLPAPSNVARVRFWPGAICGLSLLLVLALLRGFSYGFRGFPSSTKTSTPNSSSTKVEDLPLRFQGLAWFLARHFTLTVPLSTQVYKWVPAYLMLGKTLRWTSIPSRGE